MKRRRSGSIALLLDVPEHRRRSLQPAVDAVLAIGAEGLVLADDEVVTLLHHAVLNLERQLLLERLIGGARVVGAQLLQYLVARPAEPRLLAAAIGEGVGHRVRRV